jgi:hypothetical protein
MVRNNPFGIFFELAEEEKLRFLSGKCFVQGFGAVLHMKFFESWGAIDQYTQGIAGVVGVFYNGSFHFFIFHHNANICQKPAFIYTPFG